MTKEIDILDKWLRHPYWYKTGNSETQLFHECLLKLIRANHNDMLDQGDIRDYIKTSHAEKLDEATLSKAADRFSYLAQEISEFIKNVRL